ncbi:MAG: hypothetical protein P1V51_20490 [Deltaproteobacteria bacterium]|nr:hypothetical protein [Deltaproteobacteria bacterium]
MEALLVFGLLLPAGGVRAEVGRQVHRLRWSSVPGIELYEVEISTDQAGKKVIHTTRVRRTYLEWEPPSLERDYWYRVRSIDADGRPGVFTQTKRIQAPRGGPRASSPSGGSPILFSGGQSVVLRWEAQPAVRQYEIQLAKQPGFETILAALSARGRAEQSWTPPLPGTYHFRVRAIDAAGRSSSWGTPGTIDLRLAAPELSAPRAGVQLPLVEGVATAEVRWQSGPAAGHELQVARNAAFDRGTRTSPAPRSTATFRTRRTGRHFLRVRSRDQDGRWSEWSKPRQLEVVATQLTLAAPAEGASFGSGADRPPLVFRWDEVTLAQGYRLLLTPEAGNPAPARILPAKTATLELEALEPGRWKWQVQALTGDGKVLGASETRTLEQQAPPSLPSPPVALRGGSPPPAGLGPLSPSPGSPRSLLHFASLSAGGVMTGGGDLGWTVGLGAGHRPHFLRGRTFGELILQVSHLRSPLSGLAPGEEGSATLLRLPLQLRVGYALGEGRLQPHASAGLILESYWARARVSDRVLAGERGLLFGASLGLGLGLELGPGALLCELELRALSVQRGIFEVGGLGVALQLGYRWRWR